MLNLACELEDDSALVYFVEDDYLHLPHAPTLLREGAAAAEYVTLYDHPDKYRLEYCFGEVSKVVRTRSSHWRYTVSTCLTFASTAGQLRRDQALWLDFAGGRLVKGHETFCELSRRGRRVAVCIPGAACHTDLTYSRVAGEMLMEPWALELAARGEQPATTSLSSVNA